MAKLPVAVGLSLCEQVVIEEKTRNVTLVNCFTERIATRFPTSPIPFVAFAFLTDGLGDVTLELAVERLDTMEDVFRKSFKVRFKNSLGTARFSYRVRDCSFPVAGEYRVTLLASGQLLAQRKMVVATKGKKP